MNDLDDRYASTGNEVDRGEHSPRELGREMSRWRKVIRSGERVCWSWSTSGSAFTLHVHPLLDELPRAIITRQVNPPRWVAQLHRLRVVSATKIIHFPERVTDASRTAGVRQRRNPTARVREASPIRA